jgi:hypothetical protein
MHRLLAAIALCIAAPAVAAAEKLTFEVSLFGVEVGEVKATLEKGRILLEGESTGALLLFFPAKETVEIRLRGDRPTEVRRRYDHAGKTGEWTARFRRDRVEVEHRRGDRVKKRTVRLPMTAYDPVTALQKLRTVAPVEALTLLTFGADGVYRLTAKRVGRRPLHYRGTLKRVGKRRRRLAPALPLWLKALGLGRGATRVPEFQVWLSDDERRLPMKIRMSDRRGVLELTLKQPAAAAVKGG